MTIHFISAEEIVRFHDRLLQVTPGVTGMPDPGRAEALMYRVLNKYEWLLRWNQRRPGRQSLLPAVAINQR